MNKRPGRRRRVSLAVLMLTALPSVARAAPPDVSNDTRAEQLFSSAEHKFDRGEYDAACADFAESLRLDPKLGTLLNLALCHETTGKVVTAWREFTHAAAWAAQNNQRDRLEFATRYVSALEPRLPRVVLALPAGRPIDGIDIDGEPLPEQRWPLPLFLDPGEHQVAVSAPGKERAVVAFRVTTAPGEQIVYIPALTDAKGAPTAIPEEPPRPGTSRRTLGVVALGVGGAGVALGTTFGVLAMTSEDGDPAVKRHATIATIGLAAGALSVAAGAWLLVSSANAPARTAVGVGPHRDGAAVSVRTTF